MLSISNQKSPSPHARPRPPATPGHRRSHAHRLLVSRPACRSRPSQPALQSHAARNPPRHRPRPPRTALRPARRLPSPRHASQLRPLRRRESRVRISRLAVRRSRRPMPADPFAHPRSESESRSHLRRQLSLRRAGQFHLGLHPRSTFRLAPASSRAQKLPTPPRKSKSSATSTSLPTCKPKCR